MCLCASVYVHVLRRVLWWCALGAWTWCMWISHCTRKGNAAASSGRSRSGPHPLPSGTTNPSPPGPSTTHARAVPSTDCLLSARSGWLRIPKHLRVLRVRLSLLATTWDAKTRGRYERRKTLRRGADPASPEPTSSALGHLTAAH